MTSKTPKIPGPDHPITIEAGAGRVIVKVNGRIIADSKAALMLREASYPPVHYIPRGDVDAAALERTDHATYCPYKGDCSYFTVAGSVNAAWSYEAPYPAVAAIKDYLAFYPGRADIELRGD
jgi:uncharacterized protein (DUF427 family)